MMIFPELPDNEYERRILTYMTEANQRRDTGASLSHLAEFISVCASKAKSRDDQFKYALLLLIQEASKKGQYALVDLGMVMYGLNEIGPRVLDDYTRYMQVCSEEILNDMKHVIELKELDRDRG